MTDRRAADAYPAAAALICAVQDRDALEVERVLTDPATDLHALAVVLAELVPDDVTMTPARNSVDSVNAVVAVTGDVLNVHPALIRSASQVREVVDARHVVCAVAVELGWSFSEVGRRIGRDHSTVMYSCRRVAKDRRLSTFAQVVRGQLEEDA